MKSLSSYRNVLLMITSISIATLLASCGNKVRLQSDSSWRIKTGEHPFSLQLIQQPGHKAVTIADGKTSGLYFVTDSGPQVLLAQKKILQNDDTLFSALYASSDYRQATVTIHKISKDILTINLAVVPSKGILKTGITLRSYPDEHYYGLMERTVDGDQRKNWDPNTQANLDLRGQKLTMLVKPTLGIYEPFYVSSYGYGLFIHGTRPGNYDMAATDTNRIKILFEGNDLSFSVIAGPTMMNTISHFSTLAGKPVLPPKWTFRPFRWRDEHVNRKTFYDGTPNHAPYNSEVVEDILMTRAFDIPVGVYWVDRPWASGTKGYGNMNWDRARFPDIRGMIRWLNKNDKQFLVWIAPWVCDSLLTEATEKNYLMPYPEDASGEVHYPNPWLIDFTNPAAATWWGQKLKTHLIDPGVAGFKMDRSEEMIRTLDSLRVHHGEYTRNIRNDYPRLYMKAAYDIMKKTRGDDFLLMPRAAYSGSQQYGGFWGGDISAGEYGLRTALIAVQRCSFMDFPFWGSDIGGYWKKPLSHNNVARWLAFGAFTPIMEVGPLDNRAPWDMPYSPSYDTTLIAIYRTYSKIHDALKDYSYTMAQKAHEEGIPIVRPLVLAFPEDTAAVNRYDEYMYGDNILVGIIWKNDQYSFDMYLPEGQWTDYWTGKQYSGKQIVSVDCPEYKIPIFFTADNKLQLPDPNKLYNESLRRARQVPDLRKLQAQEFPK